MLDRERTIFLILDREDTRNKLVYQKLRDAILTRRISPGQQLVEDTISKAFNTSRTPVRNALKILQDEGLVDIIPNKGAFVVDPTQEEIQAALFMRLELEISSWKAVCGKLDSKNFEELRKIIENESLAVVNGDFSQYLENNRLFHLFPSRVLKNPFLEEFLSKIINQINVYLVLYDVFYDRGLDDIRSLSDHRAIVDALEKKDIELLLGIIGDHIESSGRDLLLKNVHTGSLKNALQNF
jgi:DNA-binding GntR family transcriptional regulator